MERKIYLTLLRVLNALLFVWILTIFFSLFNFEEVLMVGDNWVVIDFVYALKDLLSLIIFLLLYCVVMGFIYLIGGLFSAIGGQEMINFMDLFFRNLLGNWFSFADGTIPSFEKIPDLLLSNILTLTNDIYLLIFQLIFIFTIMYLIRGIIQSNTKYNLKAIGFLVAMIIFPLMIDKFKEMLDLFGLLNPINDFLEDKGIINLNELIDPLSDSFSNIPIDNFFEFFSTPIILFAIISYLYLEISFQINYADTVTKPSLKRRERLEAQLNLLRKESVHVTTNIDKIKEEAKKKKEELGTERESIEQFLLKKEKRFSYIREMIEKKKLESEEKKLIQAASKTRRLGSYVDRLFREDPEAENTLTAKSSAPKVKNLVISTLINTLLRLGVLIIISFIIIHPKWFLVNVFRLPDAIVQSIETNFNPEAIIILLLPIMLFFPVLAKIISFIKSRGLVLRLKQEGKIKEILASVGDYVKKEEIETEINEEPKIEEEISPSPSGST
ncbi:MAG: hypothetical protein JXA99_02590 [Candidatus Lokiarchaeota archaeon]|nr:hypothetical protein [Candidatus Lokiarchaeota archaeon]